MRIVRVLVKRLHALVSGNGRVIVSEILNAVAECEEHVCEVQEPVLPVRCGVTHPQHVCESLDDRPVCEDSAKDG